MKNSPQSFVPLAARMRPNGFADYIGQNHILSKSSPLRELIIKDQLSSLILWGPPGCGKTSLAYLIANITNSHFEYLSAVSSSLDDLRKILKEAKTRLKPEINTQLTIQTPANEQTKPIRTILTVDEVHRWNRAQQAALLPFVEDGTIILIGCTTENPYFEVISPLLSRSTVYKLNPLTDQDIVQILKRALADRPNGLANLINNIEYDDQTLTTIANFSQGDARKALNTLESAVTYLGQHHPKSKTILTPKIIEDVIQNPAILYDRNRDAHYDTISAFIKSMRGSDPNAAVFYLVKMIAAGEDPIFIARRIYILASEDIGNADPNAINVASSAFSAVEKIGLPEAEFALAQAAIYMATAPKSNAVYRALNSSKKDLHQKGAGEVPLHLRNAPHPGMSDHGYGQDYQYPHQFEQGYAPNVQYLPNHLKNSKYYLPTDHGYEKIIRERISNLHKLDSA